MKNKKQSVSLSKKKFRKNIHSHLYKKAHTLNEKEQQQFYLHSYFTENDEFLPIMKVSEERFEKFFNALLNSVRPENKKELKKLKDSIRLIFYNDISLIMRADTNLVNALEHSSDSENMDAVLDKFKSIVHGVYVIPSLVLTACKGSIKKLEKEIANYGRLKVSNPKEQKLFEKVWKINEKVAKGNIKFSAYATFKQINDNNNYVKPASIQPTKFTSTDLYNRYKQYRHRKQKSNNQK